jgi:hypothetical protein
MYIFDLIKDFLNIPSKEIIELFDKINSNDNNNE